MATLKALLFLVAASSNKRELPSVLPYKIECADEKRWKKAYRWYIQDGLTYLSKLRAKPKMGPGPGNCSRVSCSYEAAIWWCNDNSEKLELNSFQEIADGASSILDQCISYGLVMDRAGGQAFMPGNWNVIVRQDKDHCGDLKFWTIVPSGEQESGSPQGHKLQYGTEKI
ncbi:hypothetical protein E4U57_004079 [Claviceps arundinis]|uniref:Secreted protein n=1 Tax=Claviceps arundinis TaxID=1623583 RepID=A0ABQ7PJ79_9HYPO|nr:hypothetical protein E4U57_004079 [Claviceps arundinis]